eukprot:Em0020g328a
MSRRGGFPCIKFCNQARSEFFHCLVCLDVCRSPVTCHSGAHLFCRDCLAESLRSNRSCPTCRQPLADPVPCPFASTQVSALDMLCLHDECTWKGTCGRLDSHLDKDCPYEPIECAGEGGCGARIPRHEMASHQQFACLQSCPNSKAKAQRSGGKLPESTEERGEYIELPGSYEEFPEGNNEEFPEGSYEEFPEGNNEEFPEGSNEEFPEGSNEEFPEGSYEEFPEGNNEEFPEGNNEEFPEGSNEEFPEGSDEEEPDTCDIRLSRYDLIDHLKNHCKLRPVHCPHPSCEFSTAYNRMPAHV